MLTITDIRRMFPRLDEEDAEDIVTAANTDPDESAEWLPYYKAALCRLAQGTACLKAVVDRLTADKPLDPKIRNVIRDAAEAYRDHLFLCGAGPHQDDPARTMMATQSADAARAQFLRNAFAGT